MSIVCAFCRGELDFEDLEGGEVPLIGSFIGIDVDDEEALRVLMN